jgi:hypothetical protein
MLLFLFFLVFLLHDVQLVILSYRIILYRIGNCSYYLQVFLHDFGACHCLRDGCSAYSLWNI